MTTMTTIKSIELRYNEGTSDKVYIIKLIDNSHHFYPSLGRFYGVVCEYGRRGYSLKSTGKGEFGTLAEANAVFDKVWLEKAKKGYKLVDDSVYDSDGPLPVVSSEDLISPDCSKECGEDAREKALARLKASSEW